MTPEDKLKALGIVLPHVAPPVANYVPFKVTGDLVFISGQIPTDSGRVVYKGAVDKGISIEDARDAARLAAINVLAAAKAAAGDLSRIEFVRVEGFVASSPGFSDQAKVINGASDLFVEVLGDAGRHARFAVGAAELPLGVPVEVAAVLRIKS